jgi:hypothetical protein
VTKKDTDTITELLYSNDGIKYIKAGEIKAVAGRWVGVKNGVFCTSLNQSSKGYAIVDYVLY